MDIQKVKEVIESQRYQGDRFMLCLALMIKASSDGFDRFGQLKLEEGYSVYASFRKSDIERTCASPDVHEYRFKESEYILYVNITQDIKSKEKLMRIAGRRLGQPAHFVNELIELVRVPELTSPGF